MPQPSRFVSTQRHNVPRLLLAAGLLTSCSLASAGDVQLTEVYKLQLVDNRQRGLGYSIAFSPDGKRAFLGTDSSTTGAVFFDAENGKEIRRFQAEHTLAPFLFVDYSPDGRSLVTACLNGEITILNVPDGQAKQSFVYPGVPTSIKFSPDALRLACAGTSGRVVVWDIAGGAELVNLKVSPIPLTQVAWSPNGQQLAAGCFDGKLRVFDATSGGVVQTIPHPEAIWSTAFSPDGRHIATGTGGPLRGVAAEEHYVLGNDNTIRIWELASGSPVTELKGHEHAVRGLEISPDGKYLASASIDKSFRIWDLAQQKEVARVDGQTWMNAVAWSPDGKTVFCAGGINRGDNIFRHPPERLRLFRVEPAADGE